MPERHEPSLEENIVETLQTLPQMKARQGFTANVIERLERQPKVGRWRSPRRWVPVLAAAMVVMAVTWSTHRAEQESQRQETLARIEALRSEREALEDELDVLRRMAGERRPVLYLGADQGVDLVYDLSRLKQGDRVEIPPYLKDQERLIRLEKEVPLSSWPSVAPRGMTALGMPAEIFSSSKGGEPASYSRRTLY